MVVATGFFDGVHIGHRHVIKQLIAASKAREDESVVITFWPHPRTILQNGARELRLLSSLDEKKAILKQLGVDRVEVLPFTRAFSQLTAEDYLRDVVRDKIGGKAVLIGYDNRVGSDSKTPEEIAEIAHKLGLEVIRTERIDGEGTTISSTVIRRLISVGNVDAAAELLGSPYMLHGVVVAGNRRGRTIGFPTANMKLYEPLKLLPGGGAYLVGVEVLGEKYHGMCNVGVRPTVSSSNAISIETNIFDFNEDIYGLDLKVSFLEKIRDEQKFQDIEALKEQLKADKQKCLKMLSR